MPSIRSIHRAERDRVLDLLDEWISREFFGRYFEHDAALRDDLCLVAEDDEGRLVSTAQIIPKTVRLGGVEVRMGGIGNVFTTEAWRHRGVASQVMQRAVELLEQEAFDVSLLFASRLTFYAQFGWGGARRLLGALIPPPRPRAESDGVRRFDAGRDLEAVMAIYDAYSAPRSGTVARDRAYWLGQLGYAGNPGETFLLAERGGRVVAYLRLVDLYDVWNAMEHGCLPGERAALVELLLAAAEIARARGFVLFHLGAEPELAAALAERGAEVREIEDVFWMWRIVAPAALARKLGVPRAEVERPDFIEQVLPLRGSVYWTSDRF